MPSKESTPLSEELKNMLSSLGRGIGTVSVYGTEHPSVNQIVDTTFEALQGALKIRSSVALGAFNGRLTIDGQPTEAFDVPTRTLEKRLVAMKISHLVLNRGLPKEEMKQLLAALCSPSDDKMKQTISSGTLKHVELGDVKYVAMREGETKAGPGGRGQSEKGVVSIDDEGFEPTVQVGQIMAFLKGEPSSASAAEDVKEMLSDPQKLGQMILEAASVRQSAGSLAGSETMADIVVGCLRRTYDGLKKEPEFKSAQGKASLTKAMMLLEKTVLDKIRSALGSQHPDIDRRILSAIKEMEEEQHMEVLAAHYFEQRQKLDKAETKIIEYIRANGEEKARERFEAANIQAKDWQRLVVQANGGAGSGGGGGLGSGVDMSALAMVLEKIENLIQIDQSDPQQLKTTMQAAQSGLNTYADRIEARIRDLEGQIQLDENGEMVTIENHADEMSREELMQEISQLTLALLQPLTVVNGAIEAAMRQISEESQRALLDLAHGSGQRLQTLAKRIITLVGYPTLNAEMQPE